MSDFVPMCFCAIVFVNEFGTVGQFLCQAKIYKVLIIPLGRDFGEYCPAFSVAVFINSYKIISFNAAGTKLCYHQF